MVIDTSALVAMLAGEPDAPAFESAVAADRIRLMSTATMLEAVIVIENRYGEPGGRELDLWTHQAAVQFVAVSSEHLEMARHAFRKYGKGRHPAALNYGDCFAYALAAVSGEPLLFKGDDFPRTDISPALQSG